MVSSVESGVWFNLSAIIVGGRANKRSAEKSDELDESRHWNTVSVAAREVHNELGANLRVPT